MVTKISKNQKSTIFTSVLYMDDWSKLIYVFTTNCIELCSLARSLSLTLSVCLSLSLSLSLALRLFLSLSLSLFLSFFLYGLLVSRETVDLRPRKHSFWMHFKCWTFFFSFLPIFCLRRCLARPPHLDPMRLYEVVRRRNPSPPWVTDGSSCWQQVAAPRREEAT